MTWHIKVLVINLRNVFEISKTHMIEADNDYGDFSCLDDNGLIL